MPLTNAPFILSEIAAALDKLVATGERSSIYLSQFPMTEEDAGFLKEFLGLGATFIEIGGLARTRFRESGYPGVWWGEYYATPEKVSLRTIEIAEAPELVAASKDDIVEGLGRLTAGLPAIGQEAACTKPE